MQTRCSFKSAIEKSTKTMTEAQEKNLTEAAWPTDAEGSHVHAPSGSRRKYRPFPLHKKFSLFLGLPSYSTKSSCVTF